MSNTNSSNQYKKDRTRASWGLCDDFQKISLKLENRRKHNDYDPLPTHQASYCAAKLNLDDARVNVNGGAIALGHPLGATGARCTATLLSEMKKRSSRFGVVSMCIGSGMGAAAVFELGDAPLANANPVGGVGGKQVLLSKDAVL